MILFLQITMGWISEDANDTMVTEEDWMVSEEGNYTMTEDWNRTMMITNTTTTVTQHHNGFTHGFVEAISVILVSELGDKTFFIAAILAMTNDKIIVFLGAMSALATMTVLSALLGYAITAFVPHIYTYYACTAIMFLFGLKMLWDAYKMKSNEAEEIQAEVNQEITGRSLSISDQPPIDAVSSSIENADNPRPERSIFGKKCFKIFKLFINCFVMTFLAEWGDRSQLATIVLAGINDIFGVILGGVLGHALCTGLAVIAGAIVATKISVRAVTFIGALVFIALAFASLFLFEPENQTETINEVYKEAVQ